MKLKSKRIFQVILITATIGSLYFVPWVLVKAWILPLPDSVQEQADEAVEQGFEGMIIYVDQEGKPPAYFASGWHNRESEIPAKADALFKIASISKLFDVVAATKLVNSGRLSLDKTVADYFPELAERIEYADQITLRLIIQHKSGIPNYTDAPGFWGEPTETFEESLALILDKPANFEPGDGYEYCNTNYLLLNKIMDNELGFGNYQFKQEQILDRLNLQNTYGGLAEVNMDNVMSGYHVGHPYDLKEDEMGMVATAEDVGTFLRAMIDGSVFDEGEKDIYSSIYEYEHGGWVPGYQSFVEYHEDIDAVIVTFYSTTDPKLLNWNLSEIINSRIAKILRKQSE